MTTLTQLPEKLETAAPSRARYVVLSWLCLAAAISYICRLSIGVAESTIRADFAASIEQNVVHGSDAADTAAREIAFFFSDSDLCARR